MAIYSAGRRRTIIILLLTSVLLITLDLQGNAVFNAARSGFGYAIRPFEIAGEVVARPATRIWDGVTQIDELKDENARLRAINDEQRELQITGLNSQIENRELRALLGLESLAAYDRVTAEVIGSSPSNFDQRVEINIGSFDGIEVGMPVMSPAGLVGKITQVNPETSVVMLVTDPQYNVPVKIVGLELPVTTTVPPDTVPSGLAVDDVTTTTTSTTTTTTTIPDDAATGTTAPPAATTSTTSTSTSTTTTTEPEPIEVKRETGGLNGFGDTRLPRVRFIANSPQFGTIEVGDKVLTAGGSDSLAPPNLPIGEVANIIDLRGSAGLELEVELSVDLDRLNFLTVILYQPPTGLG